MLSRSVTQSAPSRASRREAVPCCSAPGPSAPCHTLGRQAGRRKLSPAFAPAQHHGAQSRLRCDAAGAPVNYEPCAQVTAVYNYYHLAENSDFKDFAKIVTPDVKWRQRGLLQGNVTFKGAEEVHNALSDLHASYQDLTFKVNTYAEEEGHVVMYWTATGTNRVGLFGQPASFKRSTFSGISLVFLAADGSGRIREVVEYRQPTHEEMSAYLRRDLPTKQRELVDKLIMHGHAAPKRSGDTSSSSYYCELPTSRSVSPMWRTRAVQAATEWVENWTPGPDLESMVREDIEEYNVYSWPDFEPDVVGQDALQERRMRGASHDAVIIRDTVADSATNVVCVHWYDFEQHVPQQGHPNPEAAHPPAASTSSASSRKPSSSGGAQLPDAALPREQPQVNTGHGSVEVKDGHLRVHLSASSSRRSLGSEDDLGGGIPVGAGRLHKFRGVTLFRLDEDCRLAWLVTFRELKATELETYVASSQLSSRQAAATAAASLSQKA